MTDRYKLILITKSYAYYLRTGDTASIAQYSRRMELLQTGDSALLDMLADLISITKGEDRALYYDLNNMASLLAICLEK